MSLALRRLWAAVVRVLELAVIGLFAALVLTILWGMVSRYLPGVRPSDWTEELALHLLVWLALLGAALAHRTHGHLGVDYFVQKLHPAARRPAARLAQAAMLLFGGHALAYGGSGLVAATLAAGQTTAVLQWPVGYLYLAVPLSGFFLCAFSVEHLLTPAADALRPPA